MTTPARLRKVNLRCADLLVVIVNGARFYLVDLREAESEDDQSTRFRSCDAKLECSPVSLANNHESSVNDAGKLNSQVQRSSLTVCLVSAFLNINS